ncbi:hypothetical protein [Arthrobacter sp. D5-1]|uniref:hypothetical protein n=1 Tax=Arthrobacter sp. D5-1 TaxID=1477518 RepID=UPI001BB7C435|nr:hypothetical protein [Arthrobacter sp. D5-1]QSZ48965.1 hypothetical protein AYX22_11500 [Arthrobacter sp. D5-1]
MRIGIVGCGTGGSGNFHNRRWDADILTLATVLASGEPGELWRAQGQHGLVPSAQGQHGLVPSAQENYAGFHTEFPGAIRGEGPQPVPASEGIHTLEVLDAARRSALENVVVAL